MSPVSLSLMLLFALQISQSQSALIPYGFACTNDKPRKNGIYSTPPAAGFVKVDLIHILCGQIHDDKNNQRHVSGFHARPGNVDPPSALTAEAIQIKAPVSPNDFAVYKNPKVYDSNGNGNFVVKNVGDISGIWPTSMTMEKIVKAITYLARACGGPTPIAIGKNLCIQDLKVDTGPEFDVVIIIDTRDTARTAYPVASETCGRGKYTGNKWIVCPFGFSGA